MSSDNSKIKFAIRVLAGTEKGESLSMAVCEVKSVDAFTCNVKTVTGAAEVEIDGVNLCCDDVDGMVIKPVVGSNVLVVFSATVGYVLKYSEVDTVTFHGGTLKGLLKLKATVEKLNNLENKVNDLITACSSQVVTLAPSGTFPLASFFTSVTPLTPTEEADVKNDKIKQ